MLNRYERPGESADILPSFLDEAERLQHFVPPFRFTQFFSPEDTLLCVCASETALSELNRSQSSDERTRIVELTTGSGLVGLELVLSHDNVELTGLDIDPLAIETATSNAEMFSVSERARFECADLWSDETVSAIRAARPHIIICNPPYVPEPDYGKLQIEAGAGPDGTAHLMKTIDLAAQVQPDTMALSWCSLSDPAKIVSSATAAGYALNSLFIVVIADGEYSGSVHSYLSSLPHAYICERPDTLTDVAPDSSARFAYLLMAGAFRRSDARVASHATQVQQLCESFALNGLTALTEADMTVPTHSWLLDRWDELRLRAILH
jgi:hypothetical protein